MMNSFKTTVQLTRLDICDLELACLSAQHRANDGGEKWKRLRAKLDEQLVELDKQLDEIIEYYNR